jgi:hypothetical protein
MSFPQPVKPVPFKTVGFVDKRRGLPRGRPIRFG